jgi:hypothetical protein
VGTCNNYIRAGLSKQQLAQQHGCYCCDSNAYMQRTTAATRCERSWPLVVSPVTAALYADLCLKRKLRKKIC